MSQSCVADGFEAVAERHAARVAVASGGRALTYAALDSAANRLARALIDRLGPGETVGLLLEPGVSLAAAALACLKTGIPFVPIEVGQPSHRRAQILADAEAGLLVTEGEPVETGPVGPPRLRVEDVPDGSPELRPGQGPRRRRGGKEPACLLYTSGSTGVPKGIALSHEMILERVVRQNRFGIGPDDRLSALGLGGMNFYRALLTGAALVSLPVARVGVEGLPAWLRAERITLYHSVPTLFRHLVGVLRADDVFPDLRIVSLTGEALLAPDVERFRRHFAPSCVLVHGLGTTEAGTFCEIRIDGATRVAGQVVPVGFAVEGTEIVLLDGGGRRVPPGEVGEIGVRSAYLANGYWKRPDLTAERFRPDPAGGGERLYRTGDLGRLLPDGSLVHLGREDFQIKVRGHRVEPGEVESTVLQHPGVREVAVIGRALEEGGMRLLAYVVARPGAALSARDLRSFLRERLPDYMVPAAFVPVPALPLTPNGKVDRLALPAPEGAGEADDEFVAPRTALETCVADAWRGVFGLERIGAQHDFFELGGNSLQAMQVVSRLSTALGVPVPVDVVFEHVTVADMARALGRLTAPPP